MPSHKQKKKNHDGEAETVVVCRSNDLSEVFFLEFRRCKRLDADLAGISLSLGGNLKAVAVNQLDRRIRRDQDAAFVDVADDAARGVNGAEGPGCVGASANQKAPVSTCNRPEYGATLALPRLS